MPTAPSPWCPLVDQPPPSLFPPQSLSSFCGNLYKKYPSIELVGLLNYMANTLKSGQSLQLLVLRDLVTKMSGIDMLEDLSKDQLEAQVMAVSGSRTVPSA